MNLRHLKWFAVLAPLAFLIVLDVIRHHVEPDLLHAWPGHLLVGGIVLIATLYFAGFIFRTMDRAQDRVTRHNRELLALHEAGLAITRELRLEVVLQQAVDQARELLGARYGALSILREDGFIDLFITSGLTPEQRARIGPLPVGHGLLGVVLNEGQRLRLADLTRDPRSVGFPPHHPSMYSLLAVPVIVGDAVVGNFYLTEKQGAAAFSEDDEEILGRFATQVAVAIANARLHRQVHVLAVTEERERIAREMHDSLAQVLGYVNTKAQAAQELITAGQPERAAQHIGQLAEAARTAYVDVRENILALRTTVGPGHPLLATLREYAGIWQDQSGVATELVTDLPDDAPTVDASAELQLMRIVQEALANVRKHADARHAWLRVAAADGWIETVVEDDGVGFAPATPSRSAFPQFGMATMQERAESVGGSLTVESAPGGGTRVIARFPAARLVPTLARGG